MKKFGLFLWIIIVLGLTVLMRYNALAESDWQGFYCKFDDIDGFLTGSAIDGLTLNHTVTRDSTTKVVKGEYFHNYIEFHNDGENIFNGIEFEAEGSCNIYITADTPKALDCLMYAGSADFDDNLVTKSKTKTYKYKYRGSGETIGIYIEPYAKVDDVAQVRIYSIAVVPYSEDEYLPLGEGEEKYWNFSELDIFKDYSGRIFDYQNLNGLEIFAATEKYVRIAADIEDSDAGVKYYKQLNLEGMGNNTSRSVAFFANPNSDIYITAAQPLSGERTVYVTNKYGEEFYYNNESMDIKVDSKIRTYKITYTGEGEKLYVRSADSAVYLYDIRVVRHEENNTSVIENGSWNFEENSNFTKQYITGEKVIDGLTLIGLAERPIKIDHVGGRQYVKLYYGYYQNANKLAFDIGDSSGTDKYRLKKFINVTAKTDEGSGIMNIVDKYGRLVSSFTIDEECKTYKIPYEGYCQRLYMFPYTSSAYIYELSITDTGSYFGEVTQTLSVEKGQSYTYFCNAYNISDAKNNVYVIAYNPAAVKIKSIGSGYSTAVSGGIGIDDSVSILSNSNGFLEFTVNEDYTNWSGVLAEIEFEALSTGNTTVGFDFYEG